MQELQSSHLTSTGWWEGGHDLSLDGGQGVQRGMRGQRVPVSRKVFLHDLLDCEEPVVA